MEHPIIDIKNLSLSITKTMILQNVSFHVSEGEYVSIIGPNGAGKTSLLKCLMGIYKDYQGTICFRESSIENMSQKKLAQQISYVPQSNGRIFPFTVREFVMMGRYPYLSPFTSFHAEDKQEVERALRLTNSIPFADRHMDTLSGGERQIVFIAAAVAQGAKVMLLDEPTTFLDPKHETEVYKIIKKLNQDLNITIISVTHAINYAALQSNRVVILKKGSVLFNGMAQNIMHNHILEPAYNKSFIFVKHPVTGQIMIAPEVS